MTRFLAIGDLHLGAGGDYGREPGERLREQELVWARALELGREHEADAVLFAGDAFHKARPSADEMLAFERPVVAHRACGGAPIVAIPGNHDYASATSGLGLEVFAEAGLLTLAREPRVVYVGDVAICCLPWAPVGRLVAQAGGGDRDELNAVAAESLLTVARGLRAQVDGPAVLMTHFSISGAVTPDGADVGLFREPVLNVDDLDAIGFDAIVAGHIHKPQMLFGGEFSARYCFYTGSPMPLSFGEAKCDHGVWLLDLDASAVEFVPIESRRFVTYDLVAREIGDFVGVDMPLDYNDAIVKLRIEATAEQARRLDIGAIKRQMASPREHASGVSIAAHKVWSVQVDVQRAKRARVAGLDETLGELDAFDLYLAARSINGTRGARLRGLTAAYLEEARQ